MAVTKLNGNYVFRKARRYGHNPYVDEFLESKEQQTVYQCSDLAEAKKFYMRLRSNIRKRNLGSIMTVHICAEDKVVGLERIITPIVTDDHTVEITVV